MTEDTEHGQRRARYCSNRQEPMMTNSLNTPLLSNLLGRLFAEANASDARWAEMPASERAALLASAKDDYRGLYSRARDMFLAISPETGRLLYMLARSSRARAIIEFGTSFGISTLHLAAAVKDNGGGLVIGSELEPEKAARARQNLAAAELGAFAEIREGDATESLARDLPAEIDLVLLDGAKVLYPTILGLLEPRLRAGALLVADNAGQSPEYLARVRGGGPYLSLPFGADVEVSQWFGGSA
jgi:predicted O-methyltransferase YrrM